MRNRLVVWASSRRWAFVLCVTALCVATAGCKKKPTRPPVKRPGAAAKRAPAAKACQATRAAFDVGSGSTKMKIALVDTCKQRVLKLIFPNNREEFQQAVEKVPYKKDLARSFKDPKRKNGYLSKAVLAQGVAAFKKLRKLAVSRGATAFVGVATSAFRQAKNGAENIKSLSEQSGVKVHIISQKVEGLLAFYAVRAMFPKLPYEQLLVWDIGGSSMQMIAQTGEGKGDDDDPMKFYLGHLASVPMARHMMFEVQKKKQKPNVTPHPVSPDHSKKAIAYVRKRAAKELPAAIVARAKAGVVYGVGGVHFFSIRGQVNRASKIYTRKALGAAIKKRLNKTSDQLARINNPKNPASAKRFIDTELTNLHLVAGFMDALGIKQVKVASINLASGLFLAKKYWK